jgi:hypothetical protein
VPGRPFPSRPFAEAELNIGDPLSFGGYMTAADIVKNCEEFKHEHGFMSLLSLLSLLEDIIEFQAQAAGVELLDIDEDEMEISYVTFQ